MNKAILIHANCKNPTARGDFVFAANIAKDLIAEIQSQDISELEIILVSSLDGIIRFKTIYSPTSDGRQIEVEGTLISLFALEKLNALTHEVIAFVDANRCKFPAPDIIKRVLAPNTKFLFIGNANRKIVKKPKDKSSYASLCQEALPELSRFFNANDLFMANAGLGKGRIGLPTMTKASNLPPLSEAQKTMLPSGQYGFMYLLSDTKTTEYELIAQYIKLTGYKQYVLVGDFNHSEHQIKKAYQLYSHAEFPTIYYHQSLPYTVMRQGAAASSGFMVLSTGVSSTVEVMLDSKLPYYQLLSNNIHFVNSYLQAVRSLLMTDKNLSTQAIAIMELASLLFNNKSSDSMASIESYLDNVSVRNELISINRKIVEQASGKIATRLLGFINGPRKTHDQYQLAEVCASLRKSGETASPVHDQALRRAASWGKLFELKVLVKAMSCLDLDKKDNCFERTALHCAVERGHADCVKILIDAGATINIQDKEGQTPLHKAIINEDWVLIKLLRQHGASLDIKDKFQKTPKDYSAFVDYPTQETSEVNCRCIII